MNTTSDPKANNICIKTIKAALRKKYKLTFSKAFCLFVTKIYKKLQEKNINFEEKKKLELLLSKISKEASLK